MTTLLNDALRAQLLANRLASAEDPRFAAPQASFSGSSRMTLMWSAFEWSSAARRH
ncbi:hypothetical protein ACSFBX_30410 [Variovorax sp. RB2P76]|jgi:hypothetical protein|uniref:hypothetical protein n=1 Tax=Variovorax sp. RB2P76 TaxID=3443736 RepID=UPI003F455838